MFSKIDYYLDRITMYRLIAYCLLTLCVVAFAVSFLGWMPFDPFMLVISAVVILVVCLITNTIFAMTFNAPANIESVYITALILILIITPPHYADVMTFLPFLIWVSIWAMASKYIFAFRKKHIFNPAAFAVALTAVTINQSASWWVASLPMLPFVLVCAVLAVRKLRRADLVLSFMTFGLVTIVITGFTDPSAIPSVAWRALVHSPLVFFAFVMITEPLTTPPTKWLRIAYGALTGFLFAPAIHLGSIYSTPELALLAGNVFSYLVSPKGKHIFKLKEKILVAPDVYDFIFESDRKFNFKPGQYLEWTLGHTPADNRGNRRYFTIASSPTEDHVRLGFKFYPHSSTYKEALVDMGEDHEIVASQLAGDFILPKDKTQKLVFIAGGIGITPFRSMVKYLTDTNERRSVVLFYSNKTEEEIVYKDVFDEAESKWGLKTVYTLSNAEAVKKTWKGNVGPITKEVITKEVPDYKERVFYISGPHVMVVAFTDVLTSLGVSDRQIKTDFFPGLV